MQAQSMGRVRRSPTRRATRSSGAIKSITDFGVFIGLPGGIDGLVHLSDLSWTETGEEAVRHFKKGDEVEAMVSGDRRRARAYFAGHQAARRRSVQQLRCNERQGRMVTGTVKSVEPKGAVIQLVGRSRRLSACVRNLAAIASRMPAPT